MTDFSPPAPRRRADRRRGSWRGIAALLALTWAACHLVLPYSPGETDAQEPVCAPDQERCGDACVELATDPKNCGACGTVCPGPCVDGVCALGCDLPYEDCDEDPSNGCEVDLSIDVSNCGACDNTCSAVHANPACNEGLCELPCTWNYGDCDENPANGCEVDLQTALDHCGVCGNVCDATNGAAACESGRCAIRCAAGFADCDRQADSGCEIQISNDPNHCGGCDTPCSPGQVCMDGTCKAVCDPGYDNCLGQCVQLASDPRNCGACGFECPQPISGPATGVATCNAGTCGLACFDTRTACGLSSSSPDGAQLACVELTSDPQFCGSCATACAAGAQCSAGTCEADACAFGLTACGSYVPQCVNLQSDPNRCGSCTGECGGHHSHAEACQDGACSYHCASGFTSCSVSYDKAACADLARDAANCGSCRKLCAKGQLCAAGSCQAFLYASACWECSVNAAFPVCCTTAGRTLCLPAGAQCP